MRAIAQRILAGAIRLVPREYLAILRETAARRLASAAIRNAPAPAPISTATRVRGAAMALGERVIGRRTACVCSSTHRWKSSHSDPWEIRNRPSRAGCGLVLDS